MVSLTFSLDKFTIPLAVLGNCLTPTCCSLLAFLAVGQPRVIVSSLPLLFWYSNCAILLTVATPMFRAGCLKSHGTGSKCVLEDNISQLLFYNHIQQLPNIEKGFVGGVEH